MSIDVAVSRFVTPSRMLLWGMFITALTFCDGCSTARRMLRPEWHTDFQSAEQSLKRDGGAMLICYSNIAPGRPDPMAASVAEPAVMEAIDSIVRCKLYREHEPDRRFVAQFGVDRAPALIMIHEDGTYHARTGLMTAEQVLAFVASANGGGATPETSRYIYRSADFNWYDDLESATAESASSGEPMLVVYHKWHGRDWSTLEEMLQRHEVYTRVGHMVHCRRRLVWGGVKDELDQFGVENLPAIVLVAPDGTHRVLESPESYVSIVRFVTDDRDETVSARNPS